MRESALRILGIAVSLTAQSSILRMPMSASRTALMAYATAAPLTASTQNRNRLSKAHGRAHPLGQIALHALVRPPDWLFILSLLHRQAGTTDQTPLRLLLVGIRCSVAFSSGTPDRVAHACKRPLQIASMARHVQSRSAFASTCNLRVIAVGIST